MDQSRRTSTAAAASAGGAPTAGATARSWAETARAASHAARLSFGSLTMKLFFEGLSRLGRLHPAARPAHHGIEKRSNLRYAELPGRAGLCDLYLPGHSESPRPVVLYLHGGGFRILSKETHWIFALAFARAGCLVVLPNYRLAPAQPFPAAFEDCCAAYEWVLEHAHEHGGDRGRILLAGESAGGNLATAVTLACSFERPEPAARRLFARGVVPRAVWCGCGLLEVTGVERFHRRAPLSRMVRDRLLVVSHGYVPDANRPPDELFFANPLVALESALEPTRPLPPFYVSVGGADPIADDSHRLAHALDRRGVEHELFVAPGQPHAYQAFVWSEAARQTWRQTRSFLAKHLERNG